MVTWQEIAAGEKGYTSRALFLAYLLKIRENIPHDTVLSRKLGENATYREFYGFRKGNIPSHDTFSRFSRKLSTSRMEKLFSRLDSLLASSGVFDRDELAIDATDVLSSPRNKHNPDPEAGPGYKSDKKRFHGYWVVTVAGTRSEIPRAENILVFNDENVVGPVIMEFDIIHCKIRQEWV